ncbi:MAG: hypothetical protein ACRDCG_01175 [Mycoplasmoidaceae bacterium]
MDSFNIINPILDKSRVLNSVFLCNVSGDDVSFAFKLIFTQFVQEERRSIRNNLNDFSKYLNYDTLTPKEIIAQQKSNSDPDIKDFNDGELIY